MKYFIVTVDSNYVPPMPVGWYGKIDPRSLVGKKAWQVPKHMLFYVERHMQTIFTDIITFPCFMVSKTVRNIIEKYDPFVSFVRVIFYEKEIKRSMGYYIPFLDRVESSVNMEYGKSGKLVFMREELESHVMMRTAVGDKTCVIMRMDLIESILRRGAVGIGIEEVQIV